MRERKVTVNYSKGTAGESAGLQRGPTNAKIPYAKIIHHCGNYFGRRHDAAGECPRTADSGNHCYASTDGKDHTSSGEEGRNKTCGEKRGPTGTQDAERQSQLRDWA